MIGYTRVGDNTTTDFASSYASIGSFNGVSTSFNAPVLLKAGVGNYSIVGNGRNRWGDYSATTINPNDPFDFWTIQEFAGPGSGSFPTLWDTQITEITFLHPAAVPT